MFLVMTFITVFIFESIAAFIFEASEFYFKESPMVKNLEYCSYENRKEGCYVEDLPDKFFYLGNGNGGSYAFMQVFDAGASEEVFLHVELYRSSYEEKGYYSRTGRKTYEGLSILISPDGIPFDPEEMRKKLMSSDFFTRLFDPEETDIWANGGDKIFFRLPETGSGIWSIVPTGS